MERTYENSQERAVRIQDNDGPRCAWYLEYLHGGIHTVNFTGTRIALCDLCDGYLPTAKNIRCDKYMAVSYKLDNAGARRENESRA